MLVSHRASLCTSGCAGLVEGMAQDWARLLAPVMPTIERLLDQHSQSHLPDRHLVLRAFEAPASQVKVLILGQDPYPNPAHANGLAFSVPAEVRPFPASLRNIFKEYCHDTGFPTPTTGDLTPWQKQGVLLLNRRLTVDAGKPGSHRNLGWEEITECALTSLLSLNPGLVSILWGNDAIAMKPLLGRCLTSPHPSPLSASRGFFGSRPFTRANQLLSDSGQDCVEWRLP